MMSEVADHLVEHLPRLTRYARSLTRDEQRAEDLVQDTCLMALRKQHRFDPGSNLRGWLMTILHNIHVSRVRPQHGRATMVQLEDIQERSCGPEQESHGLALRDVDRVFGKLPLLHREVLWLSAVEEMTIAELALHLGIAIGTVASRLSRARRGLEILVRQTTPLHRTPSRAGRPPKNGHRDPVPLLPRQAAFAQNIARGTNKRRSAILAGYSPDTASVAAYYMMNHAGVIAAIEAEKARLLKPATD